MSTKVNRRQFLTLLGIVGASTLIPKYLYDKLLTKTFEINVNYPGMLLGHYFRDNKFTIPDVSSKTDLLIVGSGISALTCVYKLLKEKFNGKITMLTGPELFGNSSSIIINKKHYPNGAHYLPLQTTESVYVREILSDFNIITKNPYSEYPTYNEEDLVMSPMERFLTNNEWIEGNHQNSPEFFKFSTLIAQYKDKIGNDKKPLFTFPIAKCSNELKELDKFLFSEWLKEKKIEDKDLLHYINYCIRDDYGINIDQCSAFAGILYFAGRNGKCKNTDNETVLTWKSGNNYLAKSIYDYIKDRINILPFTAFKIDGNKLVYGDTLNKESIEFSKIVLASPLFITNKLLNNKIDSGLIPKSCSWIVGNILFEELPKEIYKGCGLAYDNVVAGSDKLGYIYSANQSLNISRENKVLTTYTNIPTTDFTETRKIISQLTKEDLLDIVLDDIIKSFGKECLSKITSIDITVRGHAMPFPNINFLERNEKLSNLNDKLNKENIYLAHCDLSSISTFEEATYHGFNAAINILT